MPRHPPLVEENDHKWPSSSLIQINVWSIPRTHAREDYCAEETFGIVAELAGLDKSSAPNGGAPIEIRSEAW
jgi:hypothetical protein